MHARQHIGWGWVLAAVLAAPMLAVPVLAAETPAAPVVAADTLAAPVRAGGTLAAKVLAATAPAADDAKKPNALTGSVSEAEFKALHQLKSGAAPALHGTMIDLAGGKAYLSLPAGAKPPLPGVLVVHEWWGLNDHVKHWADRLAADGYAALAVDLYAGKVATTPDAAMAAMQAVDPAQARETLLAGHTFLGQDARVKAPKRGSIGWCFGGAQSLRLALAAPDLAACVLYYGHPVLDPKELTAIKAPVLGVFGNKDASIPPAVVDEFDKALTAAGVKHEFHRYDAVHAFANPSNADYDEKAAADAWGQVRKFFATHLRGEAK